MQDFRMDTFLTVCNFLNYTRAAEALNMTQPAVSQHIRVLEDYYGVRLFEYAGRKLRLTEAGRTLRSAAATMHHDETVLRAHMRSKLKTVLAFGATRTIGDFVLPARLAAFIKRHPEHDIRLLVDNTEHLLRQIDEGEIEFAFIEGYFRSAEYDCRVYSNERFIAVGGAAYADNPQPRALGDLLGERILLREPGSGSREIFERHIAEKNYALRDFSQTVEVGSIHAIKLLAACGCGITFLYEAAARAELEAGTLHRIPLSDLDMHHDFTFVWRKNSLYKDRYLALFDEFLNL